MRSPVIAILSLTMASLAVAGPVAAGIDEAYTKPDGVGTWGDLLAEFVGHRGFSKSYALVVGISAFENYPALPTANDPLRMRDFLIEEAGFDYVHVLTDDRATKTRIDELMVDVFPNMVDENDQFLFYWSGHGEQRANALGGHVGYLPLANSRNDRYSTMVSMGDIQRWDALLEAHQALFLLDACFSGLAGSVSQSSHTDLTIDQLAKPAHELVTAGTADERTIASDRWGGSIFTDAVLRAIRGEADASTSYGRDGVVSFSELISYVKTRVAIEAPAAGWKESITPQPRDLRQSTGEFFFLTSEHKVAKLESEGAKYQGRFENGVPVVVMGAGEGATTPGQRDRYGGRDAAVFAIIEDSDIAEDFATFLKDYPDSDLAPYARNREALLRQRETAAPSPGVTARIDPATEEAGLALRPEDRTVIQEALTALGFDTRGIDGVFGANTRRAIVSWQRGAGEEPTGYLTSPQYGRLLADAEPALAALEAARREPELPSSIEPAVGVFPDGPKPGDVFRDCDQCPEMVVIPAGEFVMGSPPSEAGRDDDEAPQHRVIIAEPFAVGKYEVTFDEWYSCEADGACARVTEGRGRQPMRIRSLTDAKAYVAWLREKTGQVYRLPSEAEWEYAARAGTTTRYWWGEDLPTPDQANFGWNVGNTTHVGSYPANPFGLHDMYGNVLEWVEDCWNDSYDGAPVDGSAWSAGDCSEGVLRGGHWAFEATDLRSASRIDGSKRNRDVEAGFRVARTLR